MKFTVLVFVSLFSVAAFCQTAKIDLARAQVIAEATCASCHYKDGNATFSTTPKIAGQYEAYLLKQLRDYKGLPGKQPTRTAPSMLAPLGILTDADFRGLAVYYSQKQLTPEKSKHPETLALGQRLWRAGNPAKGLPACAGCHGPSGQGIPPRYPRLQGQFADYLKNTLIAYQAGTLRNDLTGAMPDIAQRMSTAEIEAVSDYAAGLR